MKRICIILITILSVVNTVLLSMCLSKLTNKDTSEEITELEDLTYFQTHIISNCNNNMLFNLGNEYMVYFYKQGCSACEYANEYVSAFIEYGFIEDIDLYFVNISENDYLIGESKVYPTTIEEFKVGYTPTLLVFSANEIQQYVGIEEVYEAFDKFVKTR